MVKVLLCGRVDGAWDAIFERVKKLNGSSKGGAPFDVLFCIGGSLPLPEKYLRNECAIPIPTYLIPGLEEQEIVNSLVSPREKDDDKNRNLQKQIFDKMGQSVQDAHQPLEIVKNLFFVGRQGLLKVSEIRAKDVKNKSFALTICAK